MTRKQGVREVVEAKWLNGYSVQVTFNDLRKGIVDLPLIPAQCQPTLKWLSNKPLSVHNNIQPQSSSKWIKWMSSSLGGQFCLYFPHGEAF